jgi:peptidoglycan/LPS O-acetylase OafA/YrhL
MLPIQDTVPIEPARPHVVPERLTSLRRFFLHAPLTLGAALERREDNLLLLRLLAASLVLLGHSYILCGTKGGRDFVARADLGPKISAGSVAVDVFFLISGFLLAASYLKNANLAVYFRARFLRLIPAYVVCILLCALVLGAWVTTTHPLAVYYGDPSTLQYINKNLRLGAELQWSLPGVFLKNPYPNVMNGSIWTLPGEISMYMWVAVLGALGILRRRWLANVVLLVWLVIAALSPEELPFVGAPDYVRPAQFFVAGVLCYLNRSLIPLRTEVLLALVALSVVAHPSGIFPYLFAATLIYGCFWFAYRPRLGAFNRLGDYSYGVYLWGFPMQQLVAYRFGRPTPAYVNFALGLSLALACAVASWHLIEKPALRLKNVLR